MADQKINALPVKTSPTTGDKMLMIGAAEEYQIDYDQLASAILDKLSTKQYSELDTTAKTVLGALDELNSNIVKIRYEYKKYDDFSFSSIDDAIKYFIDNYGAAENDIILACLRMNSTYIGIINIYSSGYASALFIGYATDNPIYLRKYAGSWI